MNRTRILSLVQSAAFKLTLWYLSIIMVLSILFSVALYNESMAQLTEAANRQRIAIQRLILPPALEDRRTEYNQGLLEQLESARNHLVFRLSLLNLITLLLGGGAAYFLARRTLQPIQDALEAQGRFTADASHELRTPLTAMRSEIEVALRDKKLSAAEARELLSSNLEEIAKLENLSASLLRLAQTENNLDPARITAVPVRELFEDAINRHQSQISKRNITLDVRNGEETIDGDQAALVELIAVLLDNAIKYSPIASTVTLRSEPGTHFTRLSVTDQGLGIKASDIPHIFDRFYRADRSRSKEQVSGYGLGLSIAKRAATLHHGTLSVVSDPGQGTTFTAKLPNHYNPKTSLL